MSAAKDEVETLPQQSNISVPDIEKIDCLRFPLDYGATRVAANYCNLARPPYAASGIWQHGWVPQNLQLSPDVVMSVKLLGKKDTLCWVARKDEEVYLRSQGYRNARAIGLPMIYLPDRDIARISGSLLVMPAHSLEYTTHTWKFEEYAEEIASIQHLFSKVVVCIHPSCWKHGYWTDAFKNRGFEILEGASSDDVNALERMRTVLSRFEYVVTNGIGSHIAYAAYFGAKVSIFGTYAEYKVSDFENDPLWKENIQVLAPACQTFCKQGVEQSYPELFCHPKEARQRVEWGCEEVGYENKLSPKELRQLFGWSPLNLLVHSSRSVAHKTKGLIPPPIRRWAKLGLQPMSRLRQK